MKTKLMAALGMSVCSALIMGQVTIGAQQTPAAGQRQETAKPEAAGQQREAPKPEASAASKVTLQGCVEKAQAAAAAPGAPGAVGTAGTSNAFILTKAEKSGSSPAAAAPAPGAATPSAMTATYRLDADASKLTSHVGHKVEISGTIEPARAGAPAAPSAATAPTLKVDEVKMLAATCS